MESFLLLIEKIILLFKEKEENNRKLFEEIISPVYIEFEKVAIEYFSFFYLARKELETRVVLTESIQNLKDLKDKNRQDFIKVSSVASSISENVSDQNIKKLFECMWFFFHFNWHHIDKVAFDSEEDWEHANACSEQTLIAEYGTYFKSPDFDPEKVRPILLYEVADAIKEMEKSWGKASSIYAILRMKYMLSINQV